MTMLTWGLSFPDPAVAMDTAVPIQNLPGFCKVHLVADNDPGASIVPPPIAAASGRYGVARTRARAGSRPPPPGSRRRPLRPVAALPEDRRAPPAAAARARAAPERGPPAAGGGGGHLRGSRDGDGHHARQPRGHRPVSAPVAVGLAAGQGGRDRRQRPRRHPAGADLARAPRPPGSRQPGADLAPGDGGGAARVRRPDRRPRL